ncbi:hypothetical protein FKW77_003583 [Venturia effusa]|uniref:Uncharacterized protein n=1 Tax=Venturia effusa TaxID=50376 RepID=A0A517LMJ3_9PEZI|nr:hypothetical protein FKW77_003583 [Venturia effusa]
MKPHEDHSSANLSLPEAIQAPFDDTHHGAHVPILSHDVLAGPPNGVDNIFPPSSPFQSLLEPNGSDNDDTLPVVDPADESLVPINAGTQVAPKKRGRASKTPQPGKLPRRYTVSEPKLLQDTTDYAEKKRARVSDSDVALPLQWIASSPPLSPLDTSDSDGTVKLSEPKLSRSSEASIKSPQALESEAGLLYRAGFSASLSPLSAGNDGDLEESLQTFSDQTTQADNTQPALSSPLSKLKLRHVRKANVKLSRVSGSTTPRRNSGLSPVQSSTRDAEPIMDGEASGPLTDSGHHVTPLSESKSSRPPSTIVRGRQLSKKSKVNSKSHTQLVASEDILEEPSGHSDSEDGYHSDYEPQASLQDRLSDPAVQAESSHSEKASVSPVSGMQTQETQRVNGSSSSQPPRRRHLAVAFLKRNMKRRSTSADDEPPSSPSANSSNGDSAFDSDDAEQQEDSEDSENPDGEEEADSEEANSDAEEEANSDDDDNEENSTLSPSPSTTPISNKKRKWDDYAISPLPEEMEIALGEAARTFMGVFGAVVRKAARLGAREGVRQAGGWEGEGGGRM